MPEPRVFISSTFFDLRELRATLDIFIKKMGYAPIRHERGDIPYGSKEELEEYCYREIERCDILLAIIGGRLGHKSRKNEKYSISQIEIKVALRLGKQVYVFIETGVYNEFDAYRHASEDIQLQFPCYHADDLQIHRFIQEIHALPTNNPIFRFETAHEIIEICRQQWAGRFQSLLARETRRPEEDLVSRLQESLRRLDELTSLLSKEPDQQVVGEDAVSEVLMANHPAFGRLRRLLELSFPVSFNDSKDLDAFLINQRFRKVPEDEWTSPDEMEWIRSDGRKPTVLKVKRSMFDRNGKLCIIRPDEWQEAFIIEIDL